MLRGAYVPPPGVTASSCSWRTGQRRPSCRCARATIAAIICPRMRGFSSARRRVTERRRVRVQRAARLFGAVGTAICGRDLWMRSLRLTLPPPRSSRGFSVTELPGAHLQLRLQDYRRAEGLGEGASHAFEARAPRWCLGARRARHQKAPRVQCSPTPCVGSQAVLISLQHAVAREPKWQWAATVAVNVFCRDFFCCRGTRPGLCT